MKKQLKDKTIYLLDNDMYTNVYNDLYKNAIMGSMLAENAKMNAIHSYETAVAMGTYRPSPVMYNSQLYSSTQTTLAMMNIAHSSLATAQANIADV